MAIRWMPIVMAFTAALFAANVSAQAPAAPGGAAQAPSAAELDKLVGRIALYPDDLVALILPASTNPLQMVQADRYLEKRKADPKLPLDDKWDDPVKTLLNYPEIVKMMSGDLDWTSDLGEAVVADQGAVLEAVQVFRRKAQSTGNLKTDTRQTVVVEKEVIKIVPADPQVVYVPQYNPATVVVSGSPYWGYYPSPYPSYYYPYAPGAALATGLIWGAAIGAAWSGGRWGANYSGGGNTINIDNSVNRGNRPSQQPSGQWKSNKQAGQVSGSTGRSQGSSRVGDGSRGDGSRGGGDRGGGDRAGGDRGGGDRGGGARASQQPSGGFGGGDRGGGGAFGGANSSGRQAQMDSSRGASSRGNSSFSGSRGGGSFSGSPGRADTFSGMSGRTGRSGASMGGGGGRGGGGGGRGGGGRR